MLRRLSYFILLVSFLMLYGCLIEGTITDGEDGPVPDVNVSFGSASADTDGEGDYTSPDLLPLQYTVTPTLEGYTFEPASKTVTIIDFALNNTANVDFVATEACIDNDGDGYGDPIHGTCEHYILDCDDEDAGINPGVCEIPDDGIDQNCSGSDAKASDRFKDNCDGTVIDTNTGLIWLKDAGALDSHSYYDATGTQSPYTTTPPNNVIADFNAGTEYDAEEYTAGTFTDWRLPTKEEWEALVDTTYTGPALANAAGDGQCSYGDAFMGVESFWYWSSTDVDAYTVWNMDLYDGSVNIEPMDPLYYIWPVRSDN